MDISAISLGVLNEAILAISNHENFTSFWKSVCHNVKWIIPAKKVCVMIISDENILQTIIQYEKGRVSNNLLQPVDNIFYETLIRSNKERWIENIQKIDDFSNWLFENEKSIVLSIPLKSEKGNFGILLIKTGNFNDRDKKDLVSALNLYSLHISTTYKLIKIIENEKKIKKELEKSTSELLLSESKYKSLSASLETKVKERTEELIAEKEKLTNLFMNAPAIIAIFKGPEHIYEFSNPLHDNIVGNRPIIGKKVRDAVPELEGQGFYELLDKVYQTGEPFIGNEMPIVLNKPGNNSSELSYLNFVYQPVYNEHKKVTAINAFIYDVTYQVIARKQVEKLNDDLTVSEAQYKSLAESLEIKVKERTDEIIQAKNQIEIQINKLNYLFMNSPAAICVMEGPEHIYVLSNPYHQKITGNRSLIGKSIREALPELEGQGFYELLDKVYQSGEPFIGNEIALTIDLEGNGKLNTIYLNFVYQPIFDINKNVEGISVFAFDITEQINSRKKIENLYKEVQVSNETLQNFAYIASHDLQAPLRTINGFSELLFKRAKTKLNDSELEFLGFIMDGTKRMQTLIKSLLEYAKIGTEQITYTLTDLNQIIEFAISDLKNLIDENKAVIIYSDLPIMQLEKNHILRLFENLINNSLKYRSDEDPIIKITAQKEKDYYLFSVIDNGIGISKNYHNDIFEIFKRVQHDQNLEGTGIGLASCRKIVEMHQGKIWVDSEEGNGSTFKFIIPIKKNLEIS